MHSMMKVPEQMIYLKKLILIKTIFRQDARPIIDCWQQGEKYNYIAATSGNDYAFIYDYTGKPFEVKWAI